MPTLRTSRAGRLLPLGLALAASPLGILSAQNLVTNPGFEGSSYSAPGARYPVPNGWTLVGNNGGGFALLSDFPHTGASAFLFEDRLPGSATLAQTLATRAGASYLISFWAGIAFPGDTPNLLTVTFGGVNVFSAPILDSSYVQFTAVAPASGTSTTLAFTGSNDFGYTRLDDVSVVDLATVPEPGTWMLLGTGLAVVGAAAVRRRRGETA